MACLVYSPVHEPSQWSLPQIVTFLDRKVGNLLQLSLSPFCSDTGGFGLICLLNSFKVKVKGSVFVVVFGEFLAF
jgi:hypothetical protein